MSALKFNTFCGNCFATIAPGSGIVLSCGDFLCSSCSELDQNTCPVCNTNGVRTAGLSNPPVEVSKNMTDTANHLESIFTTLKFQLNHYKDTLSRASQRLVTMKRTEAQYRTRIEDLERYIEQDSKRQRVASPEPAYGGHDVGPSSRAMSPGVNQVNGSERAQHPGSNHGAIWMSGSNLLTLPPRSPSVRSSGVGQTPTSRMNASASSPQEAYKGQDFGRDQLSSSDRRSAVDSSQHRLGSRAFASPAPPQGALSAVGRPFTPQMSRPSSACGSNASSGLRTPQMMSLAPKHIPARPSPGMPMTPVGSNTVIRDSKDTFARHDQLLAISPRHSTYHRDEGTRVLTPNSVLMQGQGQGRPSGSSRLRLT